MSVKCKCGSRGKAAFCPKCNSSLKRFANSSKRMMKPDFAKEVAATESEKAAYKKKYPKV